jgi:hypothetical protein
MFKADVLLCGRTGIGPSPHQHQIGRENRMEQWLIRKIRPRDAADMAEVSESWPPTSVFTVQNTLTGEIRTVTCCGAGLLDSLIAAGRFDEE